MDFTVVWLIAALAVPCLPGSVTTPDQVPDNPAIVGSAVTVSAPAPAAPAGASALPGMQDFLGIVGLASWAETQQQLDALIAPPSTWHRLLARWMRNMM